MSFKLKILYYFLKLRWSRIWYGHRLDVLRKKRWSQLTKALAKSEYYQEYAVQSEHSTFPPISKDIFMENFDLINTAGITKTEALATAKKSEESRDFSPMINSITIGLSTGTSGNHGIFLASEDERALWVGAVLDRVIGFSLKRRKVAFFLRANSNLYESVGSVLLKFKFFDIFNDLSQNISELGHYQPDILIAQPSMLKFISDAQKEGTISICPDKIISVAEVLTPEDKDEFELVFKQTIHQVYQCTEGFLASTCKEGNLHFHEDFIIFEKKYIDDGQVRFHPIITDLFRVTQPVIRYELNDIVTELKNCSCGSKMMGIKQIEGRSDDILKLKNKEGDLIPLFPDMLRRTIVMSDSGIKDYAVIQLSPVEVGLYIGGVEGYKNAERALDQLFQNMELNPVTICRLEQCPHEIGSKKRRIRNDYAKIS